MILARETDFAYDITYECKSELFELITDTPIRLSYQRLLIRKR